MPAVGAIYGVLHFLALPNYEERWFVVAYLLFALSAILARSLSDSSHTINSSTQLPNQTTSSAV
jgi:hypothetical protein